MPKRDDPKDRLERLDLPEFPADRVTPKPSDWEDGSADEPIIESNGPSEPARFREPAHEEG